MLGMGHSNAIFIEGNTGVILIDTLDTLGRGERLRDLIKEKTRKEVHTILYTHMHPDHRGGAGAFKDTAKEIIAFAPIDSGTHRYAQRGSDAQRSAPVRI